MRRLLPIAATWLLVAAAAVATEAAAQRPSVPYGRRSDPLLEPRFKVFDILWRERLVAPQLLEYQPAELAGPAVDDLTGELAVATRDGWLRLLTTTGRQIWEARLDVPAVSTPLLADDAVYVGGADGSLHAFARFDGTKLWSVPLGGAVLEPPVLDEDRVLVGTDHDAVHCLSAEDGSSRWVYRRDTVKSLSIRGGTGVSLGGGRLYAGFSDGAVVALSPEDGRILWESRLASGLVDKFPDSDAVPVYRDETVYATVFNEGTYALDAATGKVRWKADTRGATSLALDDDLLLVGGSGAWALDPATGAGKWSIDLGRGWSARPVAVARMVIFSGSPGMLFAERETGRPLRVFQPGSGFSSAPAARGREIFALSNRGYLYGMRAAVE